jgi:anti-repressor protein
MNEIIKIEEKDGKQVVSARELYERLELHKAVFSRWAVKNIVGNDYAIEGEDWMGFNIMLNGNEYSDYALSLDFAKRLSMMVRTEKGEQIRKYFIECEKKVLSPKSYTLKESLQIALEAVERAEIAEQKLLDNKSKIDFYDEVTESADVLDFAAVAKLINRKNFGRNTLFEFLRNKGVLRQNNEPYQLYVDNGWFKTIESKWKTREGDTKISIKTVVFQKGVQGIMKLIDKNAKQK